MTSRSDCEPMPKPTLSPFTRGYLSLCRFFTAAVWCVPALRAPLVHSLINHFRQKRVARARRASRRTHTHCMPITPLQIGSTFGRVEIASAINLLGPPQGGKSAAVRRVVCQVRS